MTTDEGKTVAGDSRYPWPRPVTTPEPLTAALRALKRAGCALGQLDLEDHDLHRSLGETLSAEALKILAALNEHHRAIGVGSLPANALNVLLHGAHVVDWPEIRARYVAAVDQGENDADPVIHDVCLRMWRRQATRSFHRWVNLLVLCTTCHPLYDAGYLPRSLVWKARQSALRTEAGRSAMMRFIKRSLGKRSWPDDGEYQLVSRGYDLAAAVFELRASHQVSGIVSGEPWSRERRTFMSHVHLDSGLVGIAGDERELDDLGNGVDDWLTDPGEDPRREPSNSFTAYGIFDPEDDRLYPWRNFTGN